MKVSTLDFEKFRIKTEPQQVSELSNEVQCSYQLYWPCLWSRFDIYMDNMRRVLLSQVLWVIKFDTWVVRQVIFHHVMISQIRSCLMYISGKGCCRSENWETSTECCYLWSAEEHQEIFKFPTVRHEEHNDWIDVQASSAQRAQRTICCRACLPGGVGEVEISEKISTSSFSLVYSC